MFAWLYYTDSDFCEATWYLYLEFFFLVGGEFTRNRVLIIPNSDGFTMRTGFDTRVICRRSAMFFYGCSDGQRWRKDVQKNRNKCVSECAIYWICGASVLFGRVASSFKFSDVKFIREIPTGSLLTRVKRTGWKKSTKVKTQEVTCMASPIYGKLYKIAILVRSNMWYI